MDCMNGSVCRASVALVVCSALAGCANLRPGTYDIMSPRYDEAPERYFQWPPPAPRASAERNPFALSPDEAGRVNELLREHRLALDAVSLIAFVKDAIEAREHAKFVFTRSLSDAMALLVRYAGDLGISREQISYADIEVVQRLHRSSEDPEDALLASIKRGRRSHEVTQGIALPPLIASEGDVCVFKMPPNEPNFVTTKSFVGAVVNVGVGRERLRGAALMVPSADPGFDWIFACGIGCLVTMYGGANSHMAIRAAELGIPAVIGAGENLYGRWRAARTLEVDCANRLVRIVR